MLLGKITSNTVALNATKNQWPQVRVLAGPPSLLGIHGVMTLRPGYHSPLVRGISKIVSVGDLHAQVFYSASSKSGMRQTKAEFQHCNQAAFQSSQLQPAHTVSTQTAMNVRIHSN